MTTSRPRGLDAPPDRLVDDDGGVAFGMWNRPLPVVDLDRARVRTAPLVPGRFRLKQWQHFLVVHPDVVLTFAVVHAGFTTVTWVMVVDRRTGAVIEHTRRGPGTAVQVARSLWDEHTTASARGVAIDVHNHLRSGRHRVRLVAGEGAEAVEASFDALHDLDAIEPLVVSLPVGRGRAMYSHKVPLPVVGTVVVGGETFELDPSTCTAVLDIHKAHYPRHTWWNWTTLVGHDAAGRRVALNLTANVVEGDALHENAVWVDGRLTTLAPARFELGSEPWRMGTADGAVELTFAHDGTRREDMHWGVVVSRFEQRVGRFCGTIRLGGETIAVEDWFGLAEDHTSVW